MLNLDPAQTFWVIIIGLLVCGGTIASVARSFAHHHPKEDCDEDE